MKSAEAALERLCCPEAEVSCHYLIAEDGRVWQLVDEEQRAWHAGAGRWRGQDDINSRSIGIELANTGAHPFPEPQMRALEALMPGIMDRWGIGPEGVIGHSDMAPERKFDPGPKFDWLRLARQGLAVWPEGSKDDDARDFDALSRSFGYDTNVPQSARLKAFRDRFRPGAEGPVGPDDIAYLGSMVR